MLPGDRRAPRHGVVPPDPGDSAPRAPRRSFCSESAAADPWPKRDDRQQGVGWEAVVESCVSAVGTACIWQRPLPGHEPREPATPVCRSPRTLLPSSDVAGLVVHKGDATCGERGGAGTRASPRAGREVGGERRGSGSEQGVGRRPRVSAWTRGPTLAPTRAAGMGQGGDLAWARGRARVLPRACGRLQGQRNGSWISRDRSASDGVKALI